MKYKFRIKKRWVNGFKPQYDIQVKYEFWPFWINQTYDDTEPEALETLKKVKARFEKKAVGHYKSSVVYEESVDYNFEDKKNLPLLIGQMVTDEGQTFVKKLLSKE